MLNTRYKGRVAMSNIAVTSIGKVNQINIASAVTSIGKVNQINIASMPRLD